MKTKEERRAERVKFDAYLSNLMVTEDELIKSIKALGITPDEVADFLQEYEEHLSSFVIGKLAHEAVLERAITAIHFRDIEDCIIADHPTKAQKDNCNNAFRFVAAWSYMNKSRFLEIIQSFDNLRRDMNRQMKAGVR